MTAKTRYFLFGSALVFIVGLSIGVVAYYGGMPQGLFGSRPGPAELGYVPADAAVVAYANVRDVMNSELRQRLRTLGGVTDEGRNEFKTETGIDIEQDIDEVVAWMGVKSSGGVENGMMIARGRFEQGRLEAVAREKGARVEQYHGKSLIQGPVEHAEAGHQGHSEMAVAFIEPGVVALGTLSQVKQAIDRPVGKNSITSNGDMMARVAKMADASFWAVGRFDAISSQAKLPEEVTGRIPPITWFSVSGHVNGGIRAVVEAEAKDEEGANNLRDIIRGFTALAKMQAGNRPEAQALWPNVELGGDGSKIVSVSFAVSTQLFDAMTARGHAPKKLQK